MDGRTLDDIRIGRGKNEESRAGLSVSFAVLAFPVHFSTVSIGCYPKPHGQPFDKMQPTSLVSPRPLLLLPKLHLLSQLCILSLPQPSSLHKPGRLFRRLSSDMSSPCLIAQSLTLPLNLCLFYFPTFHSFSFIYLFIIYYFCSKSPTSCFEYSGFQHWFDK
jgi:hypothetical protein